MTSTEFTDLRSCGCCLLRASQVSDSRIFGDINTKIHWIMLKECFNIQAIEALEYGICQKCVYCLRNAYSFKLQVQRSQAELELQRSKAELEMQRNQAELQARLKTLLAKDSLDKERDELEVDYRMSEDIAEITDPLLNVDVIIKLEPEESTVDSTAGDLEQSPLISSEQHPRDGLLRGNTVDGTSACEQSDATTTAAHGPETNDTAKKKHPCTICPKKFTFLSSLRRHIRLHTGDKPYRCDDCEKSFKHLSHLQEHRLIHRGIKPYICHACQKSFLNKTRLKKHLLLHKVKRETFVCEVCNKSLMSLGGLKAHKRVHTEDKPYACEICKKAFRFPEVLKRHKFTHSEKPLSCDLCHKRFSDTGDLKRHTRIHTGEKPYSCETCQKSFAQLSNLKQHVRTHTGVKPYVCKVCQRGFTKTSHLKVHIQKCEMMFKSLNEDA